MALKHSYFFRPASRPSSPAPQSLPPSAPASPLMTPTDRTSPDRVPRSLNKLAFTSFRRATPTPAATPPPAAQPTLTQDGSYLEALSLKLSEAVSKALAQPAASAPAPGELLAGRRPIPAGRGTQFGVLVAAELKAASGNANLRRAIVRSLQRPLSVLLTNVSSKLLPLLSSPAFLDPPAPTAAAPSPNPTQLHALAYANFCGEVVDALNEMGLGQESDMRGDGLRGVREDLASMVGRVVNPLLNGIKKEILPLIDALEQPTQSSQPATVVAKGIKVNPATPPHLSVLSLQTVAPIYAKALTRYCQTLTAQTHLAPFLISIVWRALVALAYRPTSAPGHAARLLSQPPTPRIQPLGLKKPRSSSSTTPPTTPPAMRFGLKLPPSRPPTPPGGHSVPPSNAAADTRALFDLLSTFPRPSAEHTPTRLAREAVDEAFDALRALATLLDAVHAPAADLAAELEQIGDDLPVLIALQVLLPTAVYDGHHGDGQGVHQIVGMSEAEYRAGCLAGFGRAEEYAPLVGRRVINALAPLVGNGEEPASPVDSSLRPTAQTVLEWLEDAIEED